jgi:hypothetical protein
MTKITYTSYDYADVMLNVTASMVAGHFWTTDSFYNHTGVDLILTLYVRSNRPPHIALWLVRV